MSTTVIAMYDNAALARQVVNDIVHSGFSADDIEVLGGESSDDDELTGQLGEHGIERDEAALFAQAIHGGAALVTLEAPDEKAQDALQIMERHGARNLNELTQNLRGRQERQAQPKQSGSRSESVPVIEEEVSVGKHRVLRGGVRVTSSISERPIQTTVHLTEEKVQVERQPAGRDLSPEEAERAFEEKTLEMTESTEEAEVSKRARVVEEVSLKKIAEQREQEIHATARRTDVKVEQVDAQRQQNQGQKSSQHH